jgi:type VI secretion system protein ImpC
MPSVKGLELALDLTRDAVEPKRRQAGSMRLLVIGDFSGRSIAEGAADEERVLDRPIVRVDVDNFADVLRRCAPCARIAAPGGGAPLELEIRALDDFRPEALYRRLAVFEPFREIRRRLLEPSTFAAAAAELQARLGGPLADAGAAGPEAGAEAGADAGPAESDAEAIERLLGKPAKVASDARSAGAERARATVSELIRRAVGPQASAEQPRHRDVYLRTLDDAVSAHLRALLHAPAFQALEASWLSLHHLVSSLETGEGLQIHLLDASKESLAADLASADGDLKASGLYRLLVERTGAATPGGEPWSLLIGSYFFGQAPTDLGLLTALGLVAAGAGGPFLAAASPALLGCRSIVETPDPVDWAPLQAEAEAAWTALRQSPIARWLGLALPRVLLRLPYGPEAEPVEGIAFDELAGERRHADYLWGNPAFVCALLIGQAYAARGWAMAPGDILDLDDLPAHVYTADGEKQLQACAEGYLSERTATAILDRGIMPLLSFKGRNSIRLARFQSIASPPAPLIGSWRG